MQLTRLGNFLDMRACGLIADGVLKLAPAKPPVEPALNTLS
jgi:hypothetical protein